MWPRRSHTLAPFTRLTYIKNKCTWAQYKQDAFREIKRIVARDTLSTYPYFNNAFKIRTNSSVLRLGAVIIHKEKPIAFYSRKLTYAQQHYTII